MYLLNTMIHHIIYSLINLQQSLSCWSHTAIKRLVVLLVFYKCNLNESLPFKIFVIINWRTLWILILNIGTENMMLSHTLWCNFFCITECECQIFLIFLRSLNGPIVKPRLQSLLCLSILSINIIHLIFHDDIMDPCFISGM